MGFTKKFRNKKADQETQSPVIKVFKEMMHRSENANNPEKVNLLKTKNEKKRKRYSESKAKPEEVRSDDTSATDQNYNVVQHQQEPQAFSKMKVAASTCMLEQTEKLDIRKDSKPKCVWGSSSKVQMPTSTDDTCSCMTCALKKLTKSQRNRILFIAAILIISLIVAMYFIFRPNSLRRSRDLSQTYAVLAKTLHQESGDEDKRDRRSQYDLERKGSVERPVWEESKSRLLSGLSDLYSGDFSDGSLHEGGTLHEGSAPDAFGSSSLTDLSSVLDPNKLSEGYSSNSLRNFYKKLIQTDMQIKNLKKSIRDIKSMNDYTDLNLARTKRSINVVTKPNVSSIGRVERKDFSEFNLFFPPASAFKIPEPKVNKVKRHFNFSSDPTGIVIEKQKLVVQYRPKPKVAKCSHTPKDPKTKVHESEHKHPFYKHSERLDELLDRLMGQQATHVLFDHLEVKPSSSVSSKLGDTTNPTELALLVKRVKQPHGNDYVLSTENIFEIKHQAKGFEPRHFSTAMTPFPQHNVQQQFDGVLSVSTLIGNKNAEEKKILDLQRMPGHRRLLQVDLEDDLWDMEPADGGNQGKRTRRMGHLQSPKQTKTKYLPLDTHNPNWKDTIPLYPEELNAIIKQAAIQNLNKVAIPMNTDNAVTKDMSDTEYVEDYSNNKNDNLAKMAQAYSDYGVLDDKKEVRNEKNGKALDKRVKLSPSKGFGFFGRLKKSKTEKHEHSDVPVSVETEGIRLEIKPNPRSDSESTQDSQDTGEMFQLGKHLKLSSKTRHNPQVLQPSPTPTPIMKSFDFMTPSFKPASTAKPSKQTTVSENGLFYFGQHRRSLKSVQAEDYMELKSFGNTELKNVNNAVYISNMTRLGMFPWNDDKLNAEEVEYSYVTNGSYMGVREDPQLELIAVNQMMNDVTPSVTNTIKLNNTMIVNDDKFNSDHSLVGIEKFMDMIADWFLSLAGLGSNKDDIELSDSQEDLKANNTTFSPLVPFSKSNSTVGHRSRNLMSIEEKQNNVSSVNDQGDTEIDKGTEESHATDIPAQSTTQLNKIDNTSYTEQNGLIKETANVNNKTVVKRSAPDSNLIFWNDIYDEEYGVKDPLEDTIRDKHSAKFNNEILSKSGNWIGGKLRKIADKVRKTARSRKEKSSTPPVTIKNKIKRSDTVFDESADKLNFATLTANMKKVCREAAKAVHETKSTEVRSRSEAASTLMQQLVGLMSDLVEIQVQQKTCVQLPPDLHKFLLWLTSPNPEAQEPRVQNVVEVTTDTYPPGLPSENFREISSTPDLLPGSTDVRTECLGTIHDVQRLIALYDEMSEEDKSKMSGVREYLENQLSFLHKQLSSFEGYYDPSIFHRIRRRRTPKHKKLRRMKRKIHRFIKSFGKKRTRSTVNYDAFETFTDSYKTKAKDRNEINALNDNDKVKDETEVKGVTENENVKRNLPDVYYRALAEAKNATTVKSSTAKSNKTK